MIPGLSGAEVKEEVCSHLWNLLQNRQRAAYAQRETCRRREAQTAESRRQLHADALAARQAGMSYGKYMLTKNKKPAGAGAPTSSKG